MEKAGVSLAVEQCDAGFIQELLELLRCFLGNVHMSLGCRAMANPLAVRIVEKCVGILVDSMSRAEGNGWKVRGLSGSVGEEAADAGWKEEEGKAQAATAFPVAGLPALLIHNAGLHLLCRLLASLATSLAAVACAARCPAPTSASLLISRTARLLCSLATFSCQLSIRCLPAASPATVSSLWRRAVTMQTLSGLRRWLPTVLLERRHAPRGPFSPAPTDVAQGRLPDMLASGHSGMPRGAHPLLSPLVTAACTGILLWDAAATAPHCNEGRVRVTAVDKCSWTSSVLPEARGQQPAWACPVCCAEAGAEREQAPQSPSRLDRDSGRPLALAPCGHVFCWDCACALFAAKGRCAVCRAPAALSRLMPLRNL